MNVRQDDAARRLAELEAAIEEKRSALEKHGVLGDQLRQEWDDMLLQHAEIRRRLRSGEVEGSLAGATLDQDIDILRHAFFRWAARVDERFKGPPGTPKT